VEAQFGEECALALNRPVKKQNAVLLKDRIAKAYHETVTLGTFDEQYELQPITEMEIEAMDSEEKLEMDEVNKHPCMVPLLRVIDYMT
jgi:hypothetical protein